MGLTYVEAVLTGPADKKQRIKFLVDSGATYSLLPLPVWKKLGLRPKKVMEFTLADGTAVKRQISECHVSLKEGDGTSPVILGKKGDAALLGAITLENLGLILNPFNRSLQPMQMMLA